MNSKVIGMVVVVLVVVAGAFMLLQNNSKTNTPTETAQEVVVSPTEAVTDTVSPSVTGEEATGEVKEFTVTTSSYKFSPAAITVKMGDTVKITVKNTQGMHGLVLEDFDVKTSVINGVGEETVEFVANKAGEFEYYCFVGNHRQMGMVGTLTVTE